MMNAIIGGRGSGKSVLLDSIARHLDGDIKMHESRTIFLDSHDVKVRNLRGEPIGLGTFRFDYFDQNCISKLFDKEGGEFNRHLDKKAFDAEMNRLSAAVG